MIKAFIIAAASLDGFIAPDKIDNDETNSMTWTSGADKDFFKEKTKNAGIVIMGRKTFETIGKSLRDRRTIVYTRDEEFAEKAKEIDGIECTSLEPKELLASLAANGHEEVAICGGGSIYSLFLEAQCVDSIFITLEPVIFGSGTPLFDGKIKHRNLILESSTHLSQNTLLLKYKIDE